MHLLLFLNNFCKTNQIYNTNLQNQCLVYNIPQYECENSIYYPQDNYNQYLSALNLPIQRDQQCFTNKCIIEVKKNPLKIYLRYTPLMGINQNINTSLLNNQNINSLENINTSLLNNNISGISNQNLLQAHMNPNTVVKNIYVTKTIESLSSSSEEKPIKKKKHKPKPQHSSEKENKPETHCSSEKEKKPESLIKTVTITEKVPQQIDNGSKTIDPITKTKETEDVVTSIVSISPPKEIITVTLPPIIKTVEHTITTPPVVSDNKYHEDDSENILSEEESVIKKRKRKPKKPHHKKKKKESESCTEPEQIIKTITIRDKSSESIPETTNTDKDTTTKSTSSSVKSESSSIPPSSIITITSQPDPIELEPVTLIRYKTETITNEIPLTLYREYTSTVEKEKPIINYSITTITDTETVIKTRTITDIKESEEKESNSNNKKSVNFKKSLELIKKQLNIPSIGEKKKKKKRKEVADEEVIPKTVYIQKECSTLDQKEKEESFKEEDIKKKPIKKKKPTKLKPIKEKESEFIEEINEKPNEEIQISNLQPILTKFLEELSKKTNIIESKTTSELETKQKEMKTINLPPQTIINHSFPQPETTRRIISMRRIGSIECSPECLIPETNECKPELECEPLKSNINKKIKTVINTIYKKTSKEKIQSKS